MSVEISYDIKKVTLHKEAVFWSLVSVLW